MVRLNQRVTAALRARPADEQQLREIKVIQPWPPSRRKGVRVGTPGEARQRPCSPGDLFALI
jgi:hypothetical protein